MSNPLAPFLIRIFSQDDKIIGAGFLVTDRYALTCVHVVADALGINRNAQDRPTKEIKIDFPLIASEQKLKANISGWLPLHSADNEQPSGDEDVALLEILDNLPAECQPAKLASSDVMAGTGFNTFGFPKDYDKGQPADGVTKGSIGDGCVVIEDPAKIGYFIASGFSGAPVWSNDTVIGMIVKTDKKILRTAYMIPSSLLSKYVKSRTESKLRAKRSDKLPHLPHLCNRGEQENALLPALRQHLKKKSHRPFVCLIHGHEKEDYTGFLERLELRIFPMELKRAIAYTGMYSPKKVSSPIAFWEPLSHALLKYSGESKDVICRQASSHTEPLIFKLHLNVELFAQSGERLFEHLFNFWQEWPTLTGGRVIINCVCISYKKPKDTGVFDFFASRRHRKTNEGLRKLLQNFDASAYPEVSIVTLPELKAITEDEVMAWIDDPDVRNYCEIPAHKVKKLFENKRSIHAEELYQELSSLLKAGQ
jgi:Trypsin-like peptidase domain/inactive STAND